MIPVCEPFIGDREVELVLDCLKSGWISSAGTYLDQFESLWAQYCNRKHGIAVCNGTVSLELAVGAIKPKPGDEIILPSFTIISCIYAILARGAKPVLVDMDPETWQMNIDQVREKITDRTIAVMPVHIYGHPADMDALLEVCDRHKLKLIEDAAEVHGAEYKGRKCGSFGDISSFSFYANKLMTTGEGGMLVTDDSELAEYCRRHRNLCFKPERRFYHEELGSNFRMTNIQAALGVAQFERLEETVSRKRQIARMYTERLKDLEGLQLPTEKDWAKNVYWVFGLVIDPQIGKTAVEVALHLNSKGIQTRPFFLGMHEQPVLLESGLFRGESYPVTEHLSKYGLYLPNSVKITEQEIDYVCEELKIALKGAS